MDAPQAPDSAYNNSCEHGRVNSISVLGIDFPSNWSGTQYQIQAIVESDGNAQNAANVFSTFNPTLCGNGTFFCSSRFTANQPIPVLTTPGQQGLTYAVRTYVYSAFQSPTNDAATAPLIVIETPPTVHRGLFVSASYQHHHRFVGRQWTLSQEMELQAVAADYTGSQAGPISLYYAAALWNSASAHRSGLLLANTSYTLTLSIKKISSAILSRLTATVRSPGLYHGFHADSSDRHFKRHAPANIQLFISAADKKWVWLG